MNDPLDLLRGFPVVNSDTDYGRGWNDCYKALWRKLEETPGNWIAPGYIPLPADELGAKAMILLAENWLKHNGGKS